MTVEAAKHLRRVYQAVAHADVGEDTLGPTAGQIAAATGLPLAEVTACLDELAALSVLRLHRAGEPEQTRALPYRQPDY